MRRLLVIVALAGGLLVVAAVASAIVRDPRPEHLTEEGFVAMARSIGVGAPETFAATREERLCGPPLREDADIDEAVRLIDEDCRVSAAIADHKDLLDACRDAACARREAAAVIANSQRSELIERSFAHDLSGDCRTFFEIEAQYGHDTAAAARRLRSLPGEPRLREAMSAWRRESIAAANQVGAQPVLELLAACRPRP